MICQFVYDGDNWLWVGHVNFQLYYEFDGTYSSENKIATVDTVKRSTNALKQTIEAGFSLDNDTTIENGDKIVITDANNNNKIARSNVAFDEVTTNKALTPKGTWEVFAQLDSPEFTGTPRTSQPDINDSSNRIATTQFVKDSFMDSLLINNAMIFKGGIDGGEQTPKAEKGWTYKVTKAGQINGQNVEVGDTLICTEDNTAAGNTANWIILQTNLDGTVIGPSSSTANNVAIFSGNTGRAIKDSGYTIETSVPQNAIFTDTYPTSVTRNNTNYTIIFNDVNKNIEFNIPEATTAIKGVVQLASSITDSTATVPTSKLLNDVAIIANSAVQSITAAVGSGLSVTTSQNSYTIGVENASNIISSLYINHDNNISDESYLILKDTASITSNGQYQQYSLPNLYNYISHKLDIKQINTELKWDTSTEIAEIGQTKLNITMPKLPQYEFDGTYSDSNKAATVDTVKRYAKSFLIPKSIGTTKGDIIYWSAADIPTRLGIGEIGHFLKATADGPAYSALTNTEITTALGYIPATTAIATSGVYGLMSAADKEKLDGIEAGANKYVLPSIDTGDHNGEIKIGTTNVAVRGLKARAFDDTNYLPLTGGTITGAIKRYYNEASDDPAIVVTSNNQNITVLQVGHSNSISTTKHYYKIVYLGEGATPNNTLQLISATTAGNATTAIEVNEEGIVTFNKTVNASISGTAAYATTTTYLKNNPTWSTTADSNNNQAIKITVGGQTSQPFIIPYSTTAGSVNWTGVINPPNATTTTAGIVQLTNDVNVNEPSATLAVSQSAVNAVYQIATTTKYWANVEATTTAVYNAVPEVATIKVTGNTDAAVASTVGVSLVFDTTTNALNFVFA